MLHLVGQFPIHFGDLNAKMGVALTATYDVMCYSTVHVAKHTWGEFFGDDYGVDG